MDPENQSEGTSGAPTVAPEDVMFGGSSPSADTTQQKPAQPESTPPAAPKSEPPSAGDDTTSIADQLDGEATDSVGADLAGGDKAPEAYEKFDVPEGANFNEEVTGAFTDVARELGLTQEQAQKLVTAVGGAQAKAQQAGTQAHFANWTKATRADEEVGGANYKPSLANVRRALDKFATPALRQLLLDKRTNLASHPEVFRLLARVGAAHSPDRQLVTAPAPAPKKVDVNDPMATPDATADMFFGATN